MGKQRFDLDAAGKAAASSGEGIPPVDRWNPEFCGDIDMRIARDGIWYYNGSPIGREAMVKMFSRILWREGDQYFLKTPVEKVGIKVDDAPFLMVQMSRRKGANGPELVFTSKTGDTVVAGADHPIRVAYTDERGEPSPYIAVRFGMEGLISRNLFYELVGIAKEKVIDGEHHLVIDSQGEQFSLGTLSGS